MEVVERPISARKVGTSSVFKSAATPPSRPQTARPFRAYQQVYIMPRAHVSVARFYDWSSDLGDCVSVSQLYQTFGKSRTSPTSPRPGTTAADFQNRRLYPLAGRMFLKDKTPSLTKGEREIIDGICRNRSDLSRTASSLVPADPSVLRHNEAWVVGKQTPRPKLRYVHAKLKTERNDLKYDKHSAISEPVTRARTVSSVCRDCVRGSSQSANDIPCAKSCSNMKEDFSCNGIVAPPSTPEKLNRKDKVPPINNGRGAAVIEKVHSLDKAEKQRVFLNIFLPKVQSDLLSDSEELESPRSVKSTKSYNSVRKQRN